MKRAKLQYGVWIRDWSEGDIAVKKNWGLNMLWRLNDRCLGRCVDWWPVRWRRAV